MLESEATKCRVKLQIGVQNRAKWSSKYRGVWTNTGRQRLLEN
jgi:hypothetical protein